MLHKSNKYKTFKFQIIFIHSSFKLNTTNYTDQRTLVQTAGKIETNSTAEITDVQIKPLFNICSLFRVLLSCKLEGQ